MKPTPITGVKKPKSKTLIFRWSEQSAQRLLELQSGTVDGIDNPAPEDFETIPDDANLQLIPRDPLNIFYIGFNTMAPFDNEKVRQAFAQAIDRQRIVDNYLPDGFDQSPNSFVPPALKPGYIGHPGVLRIQPGCRQGAPDRSRFDFTQEVTLSFRNVVRGYLPTPDKVAQEIQAQLAEIGVKVKLEQMESATFIDATSAGEGSLLPVRLGR